MVFVFHVLLYSSVVGEKLLVVGDRQLRLQFGDRQTRVKNYPLLL